MRGKKRRKERDEEKDTKQIRFPGAGDRGKRKGTGFEREEERKERDEEKDKERRLGPRRRGPG